MTSYQTLLALVVMVIGSLSVDVAWGCCHALPRGLRYLLLLSLLHLTGCTAGGTPQDKPIPKKNEVVMAPGSRLSATTAVGKVSIAAGEGLRRDYTWDGDTRSVEMWPRKKRWRGSLGLYFPGKGNHWRTHNGITRGVVQEGQQHFGTKQEAMDWLNKQTGYPHVWNNDGLVVAWGMSPDRGQLNVDVWQLYVDGKKLTGLPNANDEAILYRSAPNVASPTTTKKPMPYQNN